MPLAARLEVGLPILCEQLCDPSFTVHKPRLHKQHPLRPTFALVIDSLKPLATEVRSLSHRITLLLCLHLSLAAYTCVHHCIRKRSLYYVFLAHLRNILWQLLSLDVVKCLRQIDINSMAMFYTCCTAQLRNHQSACSVQLYR